MWSVPRFRAAAEDLCWLRDPSNIMFYLQMSRRIARQFGTDRKRKPVLVFQNGKVGSQSIFSILVARGWPVLHTHHATHAWMKEAVDEGLPGTSRRWAASRLPEVRLLQHLLRGAQETGLSIIIPFRDPITRSLSLCRHTNHGSRDLKETEQEALARLIFAYEEHFWLWADATPWEASAFSGHDHFDGTQPCWYERELKSGLQLGIDIFDSDLDFSEGFQIVSFGMAEVLLLKMETMDRCLPRALKMFLGLDLETSAIARKNVREDELYRDFCANVRISESKLERLLGTKVYTKFFTEEERAALRQRWVRL